MDDLLSEKEQIDQFRAWWSEYGAYVIGGIVIGAVMIFSFQYYKNSRYQAQVDASAAYERLTGHVSDGNLDKALSVADEISTSYGETTYSGPAGLAMARLYMDKNRDQDAVDALLGVIKSNADDEIKHVARLRLARLYLYQSKAQEAADLLASESNSAFSAAYSEVLGDAYTELGRVADAQSAYQRVLTDPLAQNTVNQQLVQWKALDLPEADVEDDFSALDAAESDVDAKVETEEAATEELQ